MVKKNPNFGKVASNYLFREIGLRVKTFTEKNKDAEVIKLGIGDTTQPIGSTTCATMGDKCYRLSSPEFYTGYQDDSRGSHELRQAIAKHYAKRQVELNSDTEIFVSDGAKTDAANIQSIFSLDNVVAVQDPAYPVYVDTNVMSGRTGDFNPDTMQYNGLIYLPCTVENGFFPSEIEGDLIYICSPNNPTGAAATKSQLEGIVEKAREMKSVIIFDAAYSSFISDSELPTSIYEIEGAKECAIEINSFSKMAGFTGVRLGWIVVPELLTASDSTQGELNAMWARRQNTFFNGASNIAQEGGVAALSDSGQRACQKTIDHYMENARIIKAGLEEAGLTVHGGENAPYLWLQTPEGMPSWDFFDKLLQEAHVVGTPGAGFGPSGEGFFRLTAFASRANTEKAVSNIKENLKL